MDEVILFKIASCSSMIMALIAAVKAAKDIVKEDEHEFQ